jgi:hypothetical protein
MNDDTSDHPGSPAQDIDTGEPISVLSQLEEEPSGGFVHRLRARLGRRITSSQVASFAWNVPILVLLEFLNMLFRLFQPKQEKGGPS